MKKEDKKIIFKIICLVILQLVLYMIAKLTPFNYHIMNIDLDQKIPLVKYFVYPYISWYLMLFIIPYVFYKHNKKYFNIYFRTIFISLIISFIIYIFYPTTLIRDSIGITDLSSLLLNLIYEIDNPALNCFPSIHCLISFVFIYVSISIKDMNKWIKALISLLSILVILATLFIKQHVILDCLSALVISSVIYIPNYIYENKKTEN